MRIIVQAIPPEGYPFHGCARRMWPRDTAVEVEVLDQQDDPPDFEQDLMNKHGEKFRAVRPHPSQIGRTSYDELKADRLVRILSDKESTEIAAGRALVAAKEELGRVSNALVDARAESAELREKLKRAEAERETLRAELVAARDALVAAGAKAAGGPEKPGERRRSA